MDKPNQSRREVTEEDQGLLEKTEKNSESVACHYKPSFTHPPPTTQYEQSSDDKVEHVLTISTQKVSKRKGPDSEGDSLKTLGVPINPNLFSFEHWSRSQKSKKARQKKLKLLTDDLIQMHHKCVLKEKKDLEKELLFARKEVVYYWYKLLEVRCCTISPNEAIIWNVPIQGKELDKNSKCVKVKKRKC